MRHKQFTKLRFAILTLLSFLLAMPSYSQVVVQMQKEKGGTYIIAGKVNGLDLNFIFDTGASDVCISSAEAIYMLKNGYLKESDIIGSSYSQIANGDIIENTRIILREIEVGGVVIHNVSASVVHNLNAPLLFGQSAIQKLGPIQLDDNLLIIKNGISGAKGLEPTLGHIDYQLDYLISIEDFTGVINLAKQKLIYEKSPGGRYLLYGVIIDGYIYLNQKEKAIETCREALKENYLYPYPRLNLGILAYKLNKLDFALDELKKFVSLIPTYQKASVPALVVNPVYCKDGYYYLGHVQLETGDLENAEKNLLMSFQYEKEAAPYSRLTTEIYNKNCIQTRLDLGNIYRMQGKIALAIEYYEKAISIEPNNYYNMDSYYYLGLCYMANRDLEKAISSFQKGKSLSIDNEFALNIPLYCLYLGRLYYNQNKFRESLREYEAALYAHDKKTGFLDEMDYFAMANIYTRFDKIEQAKEILNKGLLVFNDNPDLLFFKSRIDETNQIEILETILKKEITYEPFSFDYATVYNNLAWAYCQQSEYEKGLPLAQKSVKMNATHAYSWDTLGDICYNLGMYQECIDAMTKCIELEPNSKRAYEFRGNAKIQIGKTKDGEKDLKMAKSLSGN